MTAHPPHEYLTPPAVLALPANAHAVQLWHADGFAELPAYGDRGARMIRDQRVTYTTPQLCSPKTR